MSRRSGTNEIRFRLNQRPIQIVQGPDSIGPPEENFKFVGTFLAVENCTAQQALGYVKGMIDNVSIKRLP